MQLGEFRHSKGEFTLRGLYGREDSSGGQNKFDVKQLLLMAKVHAAGRVDTDKKGEVALDDSLSEAMAKNLADAKNAVEAKAAAKAAKAKEAATADATAKVEAAKKAAAAAKK